jgi:PST family polysaccharide transporter
MNPNSEAALAAVADGVGLGKRVATNTAWLLAGRLGSQGLSMLFGILIARRLGEMGLGQYAFITSVIFLGNLTTTFGTDMLIIRELAAKRDFALLPASLIVQLGLSIPFILLVFIFAPSIPNQSPEAVLALQLYSLALIPLAFYSVFSSALRGVERMDSFTWLNVLSGFILIIFAIIFVHPQTSVVTLAAILLAAQTLSTLAAALLCVVQIPGFRRAWHTSRAMILRLVRLSAPIAVLGLLGALYQRMGVYLLATLQGAAATGSFSAALRVMEAAKIGHIALLTALFPAMSQANLGLADARAFQKVFSSSLNFLLAFAILLAIVLFFFADPILVVLYGAEFESSIPVLQGLAWVLIPMTFSHYLALMLLAASRERAIMLALGVSTMALAGIIVAGLPRWGVQTAGWGMLVAETIQAIALLLSWRWFKRQVK